MHRKNKGESLGGVASSQLTTMKTTHNKIRRFLVACMLALEHLYKVDPPKREQVVMMDTKSKNSTDKKKKIHD